MRLPRWPRLTLNSALIALLGVLLISSMLHTRESLLFCERAMLEELKTIERETKEDKPLSFNSVCPEARQRAETALDKWMQLILALLVQLPPHGPGNP